MFLVNGYRTAVFNIFNFTSKFHKLTPITFFVFGGIGSLFLEFHNVAKLFYYNLKGKVSDLTEYGLNPSVITDEQAKLTPIILIHGLRHGHGVWIELAKTFQRNEIKNPVFTVNLGDDPSKSISDTLAKVRTIYQKVGNNHIKVDLLGYSAGAKRALEFLAENYEDVRDIIMLGSRAPLKKIDAMRRMFLISGELDFIAPIEVGIVSSNVNTGHFGLPFSEQTHDLVASLLNKTTSEKFFESIYYSSDDAFYE